MSHKLSAHILVVDDEPGLRELLIDALGTDGVRVSSAGSGKAAVELAARDSVDFLITDLCLGDCTGLDVIDRLRARAIEVPTVVITGRGDSRDLTEASRRHPVELMTKPLDLDRLRNTVREELARRETSQRMQSRVTRLRKLARSINLERKSIQRHLSTTCSDLASSYQTLSEQLGQQSLLMGYQNELIAAKCDDDVFRGLFRMFVRHSGPLYGAALVCDANAELRIAGRFGVPQPDSLSFCERLTGPLIQRLLQKPECLRLDATDCPEEFDASIRRRLVGLSVLAIPLALNERELIGVVVLYRKGEQPFTEGDFALSEMVALPTALAVRRND